MPQTKVLAEVAGRLLDLSVREGDFVDSGQELAIIEAMKMEIPLLSPVRGSVSKILRMPDDMVAESDAVLIVDVD